MPTNLEHCPSYLFQNNNRGGYNVGDATKDEAGNDASKQYSMVSIANTNWVLSLENLSSGFQKKWDSNQPAQLQRQARHLKFRL